jgi:hypothetical protein
MKLSKYLKRKDALSRNVLCERLGVTKGRLSQLRESVEWPPDLALKAEEATDGIMDAAELSSIIARARRAAA